MIKIRKEGLEIDCEVEEARALFPEIFVGRKERTNDEEREERVTITPKRVVITPESVEAHKKAIKGLKNGCDNQHKRWSRKEISYIKKNYDPVTNNTQELAKALGRSRNSVRVKAQRMGLMNGLKKGRKNKTEVTSNRMARMRFINSRAKGLVETYGYSYNKARSMAAAEWNNKNQSSANKKIFPLMKTISMNNSKNLIPVLHHMVSNKGRLTIEEIERICDPDTGFWNSVTWRRFLIEIMEQSKEISKYFGVRNRFSIKREEGDREILCYGE